MEEKRFDEWNELKKKLHKDNKVLICREREIWWASIGENIGTEINGKGENFLRPVLIVRKHGASFFGVPLSSKLHRGMWYNWFEYRGRIQCALLSQAKTISVNRLRYKMGRIPREDFERINGALSGLLFKK